MGSKKHKKESKKKKHRSRSRSPVDIEEKDRKKHKKHKDRKKDRSPDVEEVPVDSHLQREESPSRSRSRSAAPDRLERRNDVYKEKTVERDRENHKEKVGDDDKDRIREAEKERDREKRAKRSKEKLQEIEKEPSPVAAGGGAQESLSIEQTNRLRAKLGLKPLEVNEKPAEDGKLKDDLGEFYHKPAANLSEQRKTDKIRQRLEERKEKRNIEQKLKTTLLAEESDDEDATAWVKKSRELDKQKREAAKRAALLDELDAEFGVDALVAADTAAHAAAERRARYSHTHLRGLRVAHDLSDLGEERDTVLTLADKEVLAEDAEDVLVNVNLVDDERYRKNIVERKKAKVGYQAYDEEAELQASLGYRRPVLAKYDDEIDKHKADKARGFHIGDEDGIEAQRFKEMMMRERLMGADKRLESLQTAQLQIASDYMDVHEIEAKFKKFKKKGKIRKKAKQEPIDVDDYDAGIAPLDTDDTEVKPSETATAPAVDEDEVEPDGELQAALARARRLRLAPHAPHAPHTLPKVEDILQQVKKEESEDEEGGGGAMVLDATAEFCRTLGDIPTYGQAGNRDPDTEIMDFEREEMESEGEGEAEGAGGAGGAEGAAGAWSRVDVNCDKPADLAAGSVVGLEAEPALGAGVAGALRLALSKGYLERAGHAPAPRPPRAALLAAHYSIDDKAHGAEDDKYGRRERGGHGGHGERGGHGGPLSEFREKAGFRPNIKLEYVDDDGRPLCPKEAFRYLSHKFHGKGPGKNKQEKRIKKAVQEGLMKKMSSTDTPLNTLHMLQQKQRETHSPFIVLQGNKREQNN